MTNLADLIEEHILRALGAKAELAIRRSNLASEFRCAPSQISYVIDTRFTTARGFCVQSRRGGGGYIRITKMEAGSDDPLRVAESQVGDAIDARTAEQVIWFLKDRGALRPRESRLMNAGIKSVHHPDPRIRDALRASILKSMLVALALKD